MCSGPNSSKSTMLIFEIIYLNLFVKLEPGLDFTIKDLLLTC